MAIHTLNPEPHPPPTDLVGFAEASTLFAETERPASPRTLRRWATTAGTRLWRHPDDPRLQAVSYTELLKLHRDHQTP